MRTIFLALLLFPLTAVAEEYECTLDFAEQHSFIDTKAPGVTIIVPEKRDEKDHWLHQRVKLASGMQVEVGLGGCEHYGFTLTFTDIPGVTAEQTPTLKQMKQRIVELPLTEDSIDNIVERVRNTTALPEDGAIECGDATCFIETKPGSFTFNYDFAL